MNDYNADDCLRRYFELVKKRPEQFVNPSGDIYEILLDPRQIQHARSAAESSRRLEGLPSEDTRVGILGVDPYLTTMRDAVRFADGTYGLYNRLLVPSGTAILPVLGDSIVLLNRFRHGTRSWHLEAPRGSLSGVGTHAEEAARELFEEVGAVPVEELVDLGELHSTTGCLDEAHHLFLARIDSVGVADRHEAIRSLDRLTIGQVSALIADSTITDGPTLALFLRARLRGLL